MSSTSASWVSSTPGPCGTSASARASASLRATKTEPSGAYQAGMRWPHQSWRLMHHGLMSRIQAKKVFSHCWGTKLVRPSCTAATAGRESVSASQYHCTVSSGSITAPLRSPCGTWWVCGSTPANKPSRSNSATIAVRAVSRPCPARPRTKSPASPAGNSASISASVIQPLPVEHRGHGEAVPPVPPRNR